jgi:hypothetical protein
MKSGFLATWVSFLLVLVSHGQVVFSLNKTSHTTGEAITATWSGRTSPNVKDWVGIYPSGVTPGAVNSTTWNYTSSGTHTAGSTALAAGSIKVGNPGLGSWTAYFLADNGYSILGSVNFTVAAPAVFSFTLNKTTYQSGESITATWANRSPASATDTIGIYPQGTTPGSGSSATLWKYTSGTQTPGSALAAGSVSFANSGLAAGNWTAYFLDSGGSTVLGSVNFTVAAPPTVFSLNKSVYQLGESITANWSGRSGPSIYDWVGIYPRNLSGVPDGSPASTIWLYSDGTQNGSTALTAGSVTFTNPGLAKGDWTAYFLADDGYQILGTFEFTVANSPRILGFTADHAFIDDGTPITLSWIVEPGDGSVQTLMIGDGTNVTDVLGLDVLEVSPVQNTTYTLTLNGTLSAQARVLNDTGNSNAFSIGALHLTTGGGFNAAWNDTSGNPDSWVGIYRAGDQPGPDPAVYWNYLNGTKTAGGPNLPSGSLGFNPAKGDYFAVLFTNAGYYIEQGPIRFTVIDEAIQPFAIRSFGPDGGDMRLDWNSLPGETYDVLSSTNLTDWQTEVENIRASAASSSVYMAATPNAPQRFFRIRHRPKNTP